MDTRTITTARLAESVVAVPPLARNSNLTLNEAENKRLVEFIEAGGVNTLLYGGNAMLYHMRPSEYPRLLQMLTEIAGPDTLMVPAVGPSYGVMMDQAEILRDFDFPTAMVLPQTDVSDSAGIASGIRRFAERYGKPIVLYLKHDRWLSPEIVERMHASGIISWIKYAVVRDDPAQDDYLTEILARVPSEIVVSGIGEQPAITHLRDFGVANFTSGCVCVNPAKSMQMLAAIKEARYDDAEALRQEFKVLEDLRNAIHPIRVLHRAVELASICDTGPMLPLLGELDVQQTTAVAEAAQALLG